MSAARVSLRDAAKSAIARRAEMPLADVAAFCM